MLPLLFGLALSGAGALAKNVAAGQQASARNAVIGAERARQQAFDAETAGINTGAQDRYQNFGGQQAQRGAELGDYFAGQTPGSAPPAGTTAPVIPAATGIAAQESANRLGMARDYNVGQGKALGNMRAFGDVLGGISRLQGRDAGQIASIGGMKKGSASVVPYELENANYAGGGMRMLGDVLGAGGNALASGGFGGSMTNGAGGAGSSWFSAQPQQQGLRNLFGIY